MPAFQMAEQVTFLESHTVHFGVGTPNRILKLIEAGEGYITCEQDLAEH